MQVEAAGAVCKGLHEWLIPDLQRAAAGIFVKDVHEGRLSLEWLRSAPPDIASAFLMSVEGKPCTLQL